MRDTDYEFIRELVYNHSRINLGPDKKELVSARLGKRLRATAIPSITDYCRFLQTSTDDSEEELAHLIDAISTNHTFFFREPQHFDFMRDTFLPEMQRRRSKENWPSLNIWSAASSSGEEPYSIAIQMLELLGNDTSWPWRIEATDISHKILDKARTAIYKEESIGKVPPNVARAHFQKGFGPHEGSFRVKQHVRDKVHFQRLNLLEGALPFRDPFHLIFCRNVMIYFDRPTQEELVNKLMRQLVPGGYLFVGHSESLSGVHHKLETVKPAIYRRPLNGP
ncbi:CheR family methyltransferase [Nibricoccus sp. IMCC34717]|uniref:CheR family methyltransferase n=1 Tax=Nibricoccus sp. IMCC34717 TaxID=3034021 RepID=UPI00384D953A